MAPTLWELSRDSCHIGNEYILGALAEFLGTFLFLLLSVGAYFRQGIFCVAAPLLSDCSTFFPLLASVIGLMTCITIFGGASGGHFNPAVTLGLAVSGKLPWVKVPLYWSVQFLGAYFGTGMAYAIFLDKLENSFAIISPNGTVFPTNDLTDNPIVGALFAPIPVGNIGIVFTIQIIGTAVLLMVILAAMDERNLKVPPFLYGALFASTLLGLMLSLGLGYGDFLNPARDICARLMAITIGFHSDLLFRNAAYDHYWTAPLFGPFIGAVVGALTYVLVVGAQLEDREEEEKFGPGSIQHMRQLGAQGQVRPDWRNSEPLQGPPSRPAQKGRAPPPPAKKKSGGGGGFSFGKLADLGSQGLDTAKNFDTAAFENPDFDNALETAQQARDAYKQGKEVYDLGVEAHDLARQGYDAYRGSQSPPARGQHQQAGRYGGPSRQTSYQQQQRW